MADKQRGSTAGACGTVSGRQGLAGRVSARWACWWVASACCALLSLGLSAGPAQAQAPAPVSPSSTTAGLAAGDDPPLRGLVISQGGVRVEMPFAGGVAALVRVAPAPFTIDLPMAAPGGRTLRLAEVPIRICLARHGAVFMGATPGRHMGSTPCFNGASQMARAPERPDAVQLMVGGGTAHSSFDDQNTEFRRGVYRLNVQRVIEWAEVGVRCPKGRLKDCETVTVERQVTGGEIKAVVWADFNGDRVLDAAEVWPLDLRFTGPLPAPLAGDAAVARVNGQLLTMADVAQEHERALAQGRNLSLVQGTVSVVENTLLAQEAVRLGLLTAADVNLQAEAAAERRASRDRGVQALFRHLGRQMPRIDTAAQRAFYDQSPALFARRQVYQLEILAPAPEQMHDAALGMLLKQAGDIDALTEHLTRNRVQFERLQRSAAAESLPMQLLASLERATPQQGVLITEQQRQAVAYVRARQLQPVTFETAQPVIERYLLNQAAERERTALLGRLASAARIEWLAAAP